MKKEQLITTGVMFVVSVLVLIGVTIAWYSGNEGSPVATGMQMTAAETGDIIIALTPGGPDISVLQENEDPNDEYVDIGLAELTNIEDGKMAPGAFGKVTFYLTPKISSVRTCNVFPSVMLRQGEGEWFSDVVSENLGETAGTGDPNSENTGNGGAGNAAEGMAPTIEELAEIAGRHIAFFQDEAMTQKVDINHPYQVSWNDTDTGTEKTAVLYWQWYYEHPSSTEKADIEKYDQEDTLLGNHISEMKFHFSFSTQ